MLGHVQARSLAKKSPAKDKSKGHLKKPKIVLKDDEMAEVIDVELLDAQLQAIVEGLKDSYIKTLNVRSGVGIESLEVTFEEEVHPMKELATISRKGANLIVLNFGALPDALKPAEEAILKSGMNVNPQIEGHTIYLQLPKVTREHREQLAKSAKLLFNKAKDEASKVYGTYSRDAKKKSSIGVSEDLIFNVTENIKYRVDNCVAECEALLGSKTKELLGES